MRRDVEKRMAAARTHETRARIRRWALARGLLFVLMVACACGFIATLVAAPVLALFGVDPPWWGPFVAAGVVLAAVILWCVSCARLDAAGYSDGEAAIGTVTEVRTDDSSGPETYPSYDMLITAEIPGGGRIQRAARESRRDEPRVGQRVRFRHNTQSPDDRNDILFLGFVEGSAPAPGADSD